MSKTRSISLGIQAGIHATESLQITRSTERRRTKGPDVTAYLIRLFLPHSGPSQRSGSEKGQRKKVLQP